MNLARLLAALARNCHRRAPLVVATGLLLAVLCGWLAASRLGVTTDTDALFDETLPWRQREIALDRAFPQFNDLVVAVVEGATPEEAEATAAALAQALAADTANFNGARQPGAAPYLERNGLLFLAENDLADLLDRTIDAQPFLGQLAGDPSARGLFATLALVAMGVDRGETAAAGFRPAMQAFERALADAATGNPTPLSWQRLLAGQLADLAGPRRLVLAQPRLDHGALEPGGKAIAALRAAASQLEFVRAGRATVRVTGSVALADEEFATVADGAVIATSVSALLVVLWLVLAVRSWRLIVPIVATLVLGLMLTTGFAALAVGTLNLISVAFAVLFVGMAVDFAIQFCVRFRETRLETDDTATALRYTAAGVGPQIVVAALASAAGFLAFVPTSFTGVAELGLIAGVGMLIATACSLTFLPAAMALLRPRGEAQPMGYRWAGAVERVLLRLRVPVAAIFLALVVWGAYLLPSLTFDSDPLRTKNPATEAMTTLRDLMDDPLTTPYSADIITASPAEAAALVPRLAALPLVADVVTLASLVPTGQDAKLPLVADAASILAATLAPRAPAAPATPADLRMAVQAALGEIERVLPKLAPDDPMRGIATHLRALATAPDTVLMQADAALTRFLPRQLDRLRTALQAGPVSLADVPPELARDWRLPDGRVRVQVSARPEAHDAAGLTAFVAQLLSVAPNAGGSAVTIVQTAATIVDAFRTAAIFALAAIALLLLAALRRPLDVILVMGALVASALLTVLVAVLLPLPLNFANIIALPLLLGVGVSFNIYFVLNWRAGARRFLGTATARAVLFSALTTATAFGALAASQHPGTASMGALLLWSLGATLLVTLVLLPVVLGWRHARATASALALALLLPAAPALADTLTGPEMAVQGGPEARATYRLDAPVTATGTLSLEWTDALGRVIERRRVPLNLRQSAEIALPLDMRRAIAMRNRLSATVELQGGAPRSAEAEFIARPPPGWADWQAMMWHGRSAEGHRALRHLGVAAGMVFAIRGPIDSAEMDRRMAPLLEADSRWYLENIATDFYANYHRWRPDQPSVTWLFDEARRRQRENPADPTVNLREPSLSDPAWLARIRERLVETVRHQAPYRPLFYNLGDESGIADLAAAWDFDFGPESLAGFRDWLRGRYRTIAALNRQWGSDFADWNAVMPPTTSQAMRRADQNWSGWADFKAWMDTAFARALRAGTDAVHEADPTALSGIGGAQVPGWGGYDYTKLVTALDAMEIYPAGNNIEITRSLNPALVVLTTSFATGPREAGRIWEQALLGGRGLIIWDDANTFLTASGTPGPRGLALAPTLRELAGGIGTQLIASRPHTDAVGILYSPATHRTQWMLARLPEGDRWVERDSEAEWNDNPPHKAARGRAARLLSTLGIQPRWLSPDLIAGGLLRQGTLRLLVLPEVTALSDAEAAEIRGFAARGGTVLMMGEAGLYDGRSRKLPRPQLADMAPARATARLPDDDGEALPALATLLARARVQPALRLAAPDGTPVPGVQIRVLRNGGVTLWSAQRTGAAPENGTTDIRVTLPPGHVAHDIRRGARLGEATQLHLRLHGAEPLVLAIAPARLPAATIAGPAQARLGEVVELRLALTGGQDGKAEAEAAVMRVEVFDPTGQPVPRYAGNAVLRDGRATWHLPLALNDAPGLWKVRATDILSGTSESLALPVVP